MASLASSFTLAMPGWFAGVAAGLPDAVADVEERMAMVHALAGRNVDAGTGGPFAAGVFELESGRAVAFGVNRVVPEHASGAHAEFMALTLAQQALGSWDLGAEDLPAHQLVVNWRPCVMCFGSTLWSGVVDLVIAGAGPELEALTGFDEGPMPEDWQTQLARRGITSTIGVGFDGAIEVFRRYRASGAPVYNGRGGGRR